MGVFYRVAWGGGRKRRGMDMLGVEVVWVVGQTARRE
jgi:hypothetical protein